ncbi:MAG: DUF4159 domain-containing protein [Planctomycetota bacterium]|nr:DUF4159 domain-containing protein [Planctomycetota bacterium]
MLSTSNGSYGYDAKGVPAAGDNSNSIYALVGVAAAAEAGVDVPAAYWRKVKTYWESAQCADGGWVYSSKAAKGNPNMSAAGATALLLCSGNLYRETFAGGSPTREAQNTQAAIGRGLDWLDHKFAGATVTATSYDGAPGSVDIYFLHNAERAALASGTRCFGDSDWYKTGADLLLKAQAPNGTWKSSYDAAVAAAQGMLFLVRGSRPIAFNKLKYGGDWNNRPHALAALTRWMGSTAFTQEPSWRVVSLEAQPADWHDAPILLITGSKAHGFTKEELDKLRAFVEQGGTIFSVTESGGDGFETGMRQAYAKLFPSHELAEAPLTHELYRIGENLAGSDIRFRLVSDGTRVLAVHVAKDLLRNWQANRTQDEKPSFAAALNVYLYLTNKP